MSQNPLSFWPLDDDASTGIAKEATGKGNDGIYSGPVFDEAIPLVANGQYGIRLYDDDSTIYYPCPGATGSGITWSNGNIWGKGKEKQPFSIELYFKLEADTKSLVREQVLFGNTVIVLGSSNAENVNYTDLIENYNTYSEVLAEFATYGEILNAEVLAPYGVYVYKNRIYFRPDPEINYYVSYQVPDWKKRYHVVANYSQSGISMIVNGTNYVSKSVEDIDVDFNFTRTNPLFVSDGSDEYPVTVDAVAIYPNVVERVRAQDNCDLSRKTVSKAGYFNSNSQVYYMPNNTECLIAYRFVNNWTDFNFTNVIINDKNELTLRSITDQVITGTSTTKNFNSVGGRTAMTLASDQHLDISNIVSSIERGSGISVSFYHSTTTPQRALISMENLVGGQSLACWINSSNNLVVTYNGNNIVGSTVTAGWNEILVVNKSSGLEVYLNGISEYDGVDYINIVNNCYIGRYGSLYIDCPISWVGIKSNTQYQSITNNTLYNQNSDFFLKFQNNTNWSQYGTVTGSLFVPQTTYGGSLAFHNTSSSNVSVTYNNGLLWPTMGTMPGITSTAQSTVTDFDITISLLTNDSEEDLPILTNIGLYAYSNGMKRVISENSSDKAVIMNLDDSIIFDDDVEILDRLDQSGIKLSGSSYLKIPSQSKNLDTGGFDGTKSISMVIKLNEPLTANKYILQSGSKSVYWDGTAWQYPGFTNMYVNGYSSFQNRAMIGDWAHIALTSTSKINAGTDIYVGSDSNGSNGIDMTVGAFSMAAYTFDSEDVENEFEMFTGRPQESIALDNLSFTVTDYGMIPYRIGFQTA